MKTDKREVRRVIYLSDSEATLIDEAAAADLNKPAPWIRAAAIRAAKAMGKVGK